MRRVGPSLVPFVRRRVLACALIGLLWPHPMLGNESEAAAASDPALMAEEPRGELRLADALAAALLRNPSLAAFSGEIRVREARALQAGLLPNPELLVEVENVAGTGDFSGSEQAETTLLLGQPIELGGKRAKRRRLAERDTALAGWDYRLARAEVLAEVARAFAELLVAQEQRELARELRGLAEQSLAAVAPGSSGPGPAVESARAEVTLVSREIESQRAEAALATARLRLAALWGSREARFESAHGDLRDVRPPPALPELLARLDEGPELARWADEIERHEAAVALEDSQRIPDVTAAAGFRRLEESEDSVLLFGLAVPFPVFDRNQGERLAARSELSSARHRREAARVRVETELRVSLSELASSHAEIEALRGRALPRLEQAQRVVRDGHARGLFEPAELWDAQGTLVELRMRELDALLRYHAAAAQIERLTGQPVWERPGPSGPVEGGRRAP